MVERYRQMLDLAQGAIERRDRASDELEAALDGEQREPLTPPVLRAEQVHGEDSTERST